MTRILTPEEWHLWFTVQAAWTRSTRVWLFRQARVSRAHAVLEVGSGTGVIAEELAELGPDLVVGLDLDAGMVAFSHCRGKDVAYVGGDAHALPFPARSFDVVLCHYLLLWLLDPAHGVREMARVVRPGGYVVACGEPDYGGRLDYPPELISLGRLQAEALREQGGEPEIGRRLGELFVGAGLRTTVGVIAGRWRVPARPDRGFEAEWAMRERDLAGLASPADLRRWRQVDRQALIDGRRVLFVPTFYALGQKTG